MKRGCEMKVFEKYNQYAVKEAICSICDRLFYEAEKNDEIVDISTLNIKCRNDYGEDVIRVEATVESSPRQLEYRELMAMYLDERYREKKQDEDHMYDSGAT